MHVWGDDFFKENGKDLDAAIHYIMNTWLKFGRIGSHGKEKYGTFRDHPYFWQGGIHDLIWPGYVSIQNEFLYWVIDYKILRPFMRITGLLRLGVWYQEQVYNYAVQKMCKKYPKIVDELVSDLEYYDLIKPGIFGKVDGTVIHKKYWRTYEC